MNSKYFTKSNTMCSWPQKYSIVPEVIDQPPKYLCQIKHYNGSHAENGNHLTMRQVLDMPKVYWPAEDSSLYVLVMIDPDAPSSSFPSLREWLHWLIGNIPGNDIAKGDVIAEFIGPAPPKRTGYHRYVFLIFKQMDRIVFDEQKMLESSANGRAHFSIRTFAKKYNLGEPIAGNFYLVKWDNYIAEMCRKIEKAVYTPTESLNLLTLCTSEYALLDEEVSEVIASKPAKRTRISKKIKISESSNTFVAHSNIVPDQKINEGIDSVCGNKKNPTESTISGRRRRRKRGSTIKNQAISSTASSSKMTETTESSKTTNSGRILKDFRSIPVDKEMLKEFLKPKLSALDGNGSFDLKSITIR